MNPHETLAKSPSLLLLAASLLGVSLVLLSMPVAPFRHYVGDTLQHLYRQGAYGMLALTLAWSVGRFGLHRPLLRHWYVFSALLFLAIVYATLTLTAGNGPVMIRYGWWARTTGQIAFLLALVFALSAVLPGYARCEPYCRLALSGCLLLSVAVPSLFIKDAGVLLVALAIWCLTCSVVLPPKRLALALPGVFAVFFLAFCGSCVLYPQSFGRQFHMILHAAPNFQLNQALVSVHAGGLFGNAVSPTWIPEWHTDFLFARLCNAGGLAAGAAALFVTGLLLSLAWRSVGRQTDLNTRALAAGCAAALTAPALLHVAVNLGLFPTTGTHFPFFSYSPRLLLLDGLLVGLLLSLGREAPSETAGALEDRAAYTPFPRWPQAYIQAGVALLLVLFALRLGVLVFSTPGLRSGYTPGAESHKTPVRGRILDVKGRVLAQTGERLIACVDPQLLAKPENRQRIPEIARLLGMEEQTLWNNIKEPRLRYVRLKKDLTPETADTIRGLKLNTFFIDAVPVRIYPFDTPLAHVVGCAGSAEDYRGLSGMEVTRNALLKEGGDMRLTLDIDLQTALQGLAEAAAKETGAKQAQIVVMDARTGALRAAAQVPALHGQASRDDLKPLLWFATGEVFEPGGLFKPLVAAAALERGVITPESRISCEQGVWIYQGLPLRDPSPQGELTPAEILQKGSNIGMAKIGLLLGAGPLYEAVAGWSMNQRCAAGLNTGELGILHTTNRWTKLEVTRLPIGHGCAVTLLQLLRAYSALFNDGRMVEPTLIAATRPAPGADWQPAPVAEPKSVIRPETAAWLRATLKKDLGDSLSTIGQPGIVQKTLTNDSGYDPARVLTAFIGSQDLEGTPHLIAVWLDEPTRGSDPNPAVGIFVNAAQTIRRMQP